MSTTQSISLPDVDAWEAACQVGDSVVRTAIGEKAMRRMKRDAPLWDPLALGFGAHKAVVEYLMTCVAPEGASVIETNLIAAVRGVCRGAEFPLNEDGTPFQPATGG